MKKLLVCLLAIGMVAGLVLSGCAPAEEGAPARRTVVLATHPTGSSMYLSATAIGPLVTKYSNLDVAVVPTGGSGPAHEMVAAGKAQLGTMSSLMCGTVVLTGG